MKKCGFQNSWQNKHWLLSPSSYQRGQTNPNIPSGGTGASPNYFSMSNKGTAYTTVDDDDYDMERVFVSAPLIDDLGVYRIGVLFHRDRYNASTCTAYTFIAECGSDGRIVSFGSSSKTSLDSSVFAGSVGKAWCIYKKSGYSWATAINNIPLITENGINLTINGNAHAVYKKIKDSWTYDIPCISMAFCDAISEATQPDGALTPETTTPEPNDICTRMETFKGDWVYWYGGSGQIANKSLLQSLASSYPKIYTSSYIAKARADINGHTRVADCSYAVSYAYNIGRTNSTWFLNNYATWTGTPKNGMFLVRSGHVAIYRDGHTMEMVGIDYDYQENPYVASKWARVGYDPNRQY